MGIDVYVAEVIAKHHLRSEEGARKLGSKWDSFSLVRFLEEAQEEAMDLAIYLERAIWRIRNREAEDKGGTEESKGNNKGAS